MSFKMALFVASALLFLHFPASPLQAADVPKGNVNWPGGFISVIGRGTADPSGNPVRDKMMADRAAVVDAYRALAEAIYGVRVNSQTNIGKMAEKETIVKTQVVGLVQGAQVVSQKVEWSGNTPLATVEMRICMSNDAPGCKAKTSVIATLEPQKWPEPSYVPEKKYPIVPAVYVEPPTSVVPPAPPPKQTESPEETRFPRPDPSRPVTGVILCLEGRSFERELLPVVIMEQGAERLTVYSVKIVKPDVVRTYGIVRYADSLELGMKVAHLGNNILVLPVKGIDRNNMIVISETSARTIRESTYNDNNYLVEAKVAVVSNR